MQTKTTDNKAQLIFTNEKLIFIDLIYHSYTNYRTLEAINSPRAFIALKNALAVFKHCIGLEVSRTREQALMRDQPKSISEIKSSELEDDNEVSSKLLPDHPLVKNDNVKREISTVNPKPLKSCLKKHRKKKSNRQEVLEKFNYELEDSLQTSGKLFCEYDKKKLLKFMSDYLRLRENLSADNLAEVKTIFSDYVKKAAYKPWSAKLAFSETESIDYNQFIDITGALNAIFYPSHNNFEQEFVYL